MSTVNGFRIERRTVASLTPAPYNPRIISRKALAGLEASMKTFGIPEPIILNERTGNVVGGHQRLAVLAKNKTAETDVIVGDWEPSEEKALNVTLNNPHIQGEFDKELLTDLLDQLQVTDDTLFADLRLDTLALDFSDVDAGKLASDLAAAGQVAFADTFELVVTCKNEDDQRELYDRLNEDGYNVRILQI